MLRLLFVTLPLFLSLPLKAEFLDLPPSELQAMLDQGVPLVDIRTKREWQQTGVVEGSRLITFFDEKGGYDVEKWMTEFSEVATADQPVILICRTGNRTGQIGQFLDRKMGYRKVYHVAGGIKAWLRTGKNSTVATVR